MIEVRFGESEAGSMKIAKNNCTDETFIIGGNSSHSDEMKTKRIPCNLNEVICLGFMLDIGDIKETINSKYRKDIIFSMYNQSGWEDEPEALQELRMVGSIYYNELKRLLEFLENGESIRIWYSDCPYSLCGFYYLCNMMEAYSNDIFVVMLPKYLETKENTVTHYKNWSEVAPEEFSQFLAYEKKLTAIERKMYGQKWSELVEDNSPLRAIVNGTLIGVQEDFYDFLIKKHITSKPIKEARLIGEILGQYPLGIGDWWYAKRIESMINAGSIRVVEDSIKKYTRVICKA